MLKQNYYNDFFEIGQQKINFSFFELSLPDDDPVYTLKNVMEKLDFSGLLDTIDALYSKYNTFLLENGYGPKYDLGDARMLVIDHCSPLEILKLQKNLMRIAKGEGIGFVYGKGKHKPEIQKLYEELEEYGIRLMEYKECFEFMLYALSRNILKYHPKIRGIKKETARQRIQFLKKSEFSGIVSFLRVRD